MVSSEEKLLTKIVQAQAKKQKIQASGKRQKEPNLLGVSDALDAYYFLCKMKNYCTYLAYKPIVAEKNMPKASDFKLMSAIIEQIEQQDLEGSSLLNIYNKIRLLYEGLENPSLTELPVNFDDLLSNVEQIVFKIPLNEGVEIYSYLSNYCIRQQQAGNKTFYLTLFWIYNAMLNLKGKKSRSKILVNHGVFKNIVTLVALHLKKSPIFGQVETFGLEPAKDTGFKDAFDWVEKFIDFYQYKIERKDRLIYADYCRAYVAFEQKNFVKARIILQEPHHIHGMFINFDSKRLYLKILFELFIQKNENRLSVDIQQFLESYRGLLKDEQRKKKQLSPEHYNYYQTFYKCYERLYQCSAYRERLPFEQDFRAELQALMYPFKVWFLDKLEALDRRRKK